MLTDVVGFSARAHRNEHVALVLLRELDGLVRPILARSEGRIVKGLGDGLLVEFPSALAAVTAAVEIQRAVAGRFPEGTEEPLRIRVGVHLGDVVRQGGDLLGDAVNIVSRIEPLASPGGICISQQVLDQVRNKTDLVFSPIGTPTLKNIGAEIPLYGVSWERRAAPPAPRAAGPPRVAVLPLVNLSGRADEEYFVDGVTEELIQVLSRIAGLRVIGRSSVMRFKSGSPGPAEIARELGATAVVEGSIRKSGSRVRLNARLLDPSSAEALWSAEYDREDQDLFALQSEISQRVAKALEVELLGRERSSLQRPPTPDAAAHTMLLRGRYLQNQRQEASLRQSLIAFRQALRRDPRMAAGYAGVADAYSNLAWLEFVRPSEAFPKARAAASRAIALDPGLAEAHASLGFVRFLYDRRWSEAERSFREAIARNPSYPIAHQFYSDLLKARGRFAEAEAEIRRALELDPLSLAINTALGHVLYLARRYEEAIVQYRRALTLDPGFGLAHLWFGRPYLETGDFGAAIREVKTAVRLSKQSTMSLSVLAHAYASAGQVGAARRILRRLNVRGRSRYVPSYWIGLIHSGLGDLDQAFVWLNRAARERSAWLAWIKVEPRFDRLRADPRFPELVRRLGVE